ncbi:MAG: hypothetical protein AABY22_32155 [Nanoarchaeota archaeon]|mgnify:CR=1 FL=1
MILHSSFLSLIHIESDVLSCPLCLGDTIKDSEWSYRCACVHEFYIYNITTQDWKSNPTTGQLNKLYFIFQDRNKYIVAVEVTCKSDKFVVNVDRKEWDDESELEFEVSPDTDIFDLEKLEKKINIYRALK